jgi:hypothetical protein
MNGHEALTGDRTQSPARLGRGLWKTGSMGFAQEQIFHLGNVMEVTR